MSDTIPPMTMIWDGEVMRPLHPKQADKYFVVGERYTLEQRMERSGKSHAHFFAMVREAWQNLPERLAEQFPNEDALRKYALIKAGFCDMATHVCPSHAAAVRLQQFLKPIDPYSIIEAKGATVVRYSAKSQSVRAMGAKEFQRSKEATLDILAQMIGTSRTELERARAA